MYIGKLAKLTGASPKAIRLYESIGLIPAPARQGKYRVYTDKDVALVHMIRRAQAVGFNLAELKELVALKSQNSQFPIKIANKLIASKREKLRSDMDKIMSLDRQLIELHEELNRTFGKT
ncbi:MAG: MerR family transcriptional regulator [Nitrosomonadales bacterium]|nr:MerR family transcriptional regulator [Nitrosomonadales bacterium]